MLAQSFQSAADLKITEPQKDALIKTLVLLETGKMRHEPHDPRADFGRSKQFSGHFNMHSWQREHDCGTVACIGGTAEIVGNVKFPLSHDGRPDALGDLFEPDALDWRSWKDITTEQAARALRSYLTTGDAKWAEAVSA